MEKDQRAVLRGENQRREPRNNKDTQLMEGMKERKEGGGKQREN